MCLSVEVERQTFFLGGPCFNELTLWIYPVTDCNSLVLVLAISIRNKKSSMYRDMYIINMQSKFVLIQYNVGIIIRHMFCEVHFKIHQKSSGKY